MEPIKTTLIHTVAPFNSRASAPRPTVVLLHGRGADENDLSGLASYLDPRLLVISARAPFRFPFGGYMWYEVLEVGKPEPAQFAESYEKLLQFVADIKQYYPVDPDRLLLLGFSMGTMMAYSIALTKPAEIKGVVAHSGYIPENMHLHFRLNDLRHTSFFVAHGTLDPVIPVQFGRRAKELLSKTGAELTYREYPIAHQISEESLHDLSTWLRQSIEPKTSEAAS